MKTEDLDKHLVAATENGHHISPILEEGIKIILIHAPKSSQWNRFAHLYTVDF